jgi:hypothetical protein
MNVVFWWVAQWLGLAAQLLLACAACMMYFSARTLCTLLYLCIVALKCTLYPSVKLPVHEKTFLERCVNGAWSNPGPECVRNLK